MATSQGNAKRDRGAEKRLRYFFLNGELHKKIHVSSGTDHLVAFNYTQGKMVGYSFTDVKKHSKPGFKMGQVCQMINRSRVVLENAILNGDIPTPQRTYAYKDGQDPNWSMYIWSEEDIMNLHAYLCTQHNGMPRKDGRITPRKLPTPRELRAMMRQEVVLYVKNNKGEFVPTWAAHDF